MSLSTPERPDQPVEGRRVFAPGSFGIGACGSRGGGLSRFDEKPALERLPFQGAIFRRAAGNPFERRPTHASQALGGWSEYPSGSSASCRLSGCAATIKVAGSPTIILAG